MLIKSRKIEYVENPNGNLTGFVESDFTTGKNGSREKSTRAGAASLKEKKEKDEQMIRVAAQEGFDRGLSEGVSRGREVERKKSLSALAAFEKALNDLARIRRETLSQLEPQILDLALAIAEKVIHSEIRTNREVFLGVLKEALRNILDKEGMTIRLNPVDYDYMLEVNPRILNSFEGVKDPVFQRDDSIEQGGVVVETLFGQVDARLDSQMREIQSAMVRKG